MAFVRCGGGTKKVKPLNTLDTLGRSMTKWVKNSYYIGVAYGGLTGNYGSWNGASGDTVNMTSNTGYVPGLVTNCEADNTYNLRVTFSGVSPSEAKNVGILFFNSSGSFLNQIWDSGTQDSFNETFTVPNNAAYTVLLLRRNENGAFNVTINSFTEM